MPGRTRWLMSCLITTLCLPLTATRADEAALPALQAWLSKPEESRSDLNEQEFAKLPLSAEEANEARNLIWQHLAEQWKDARRAEYEARKVSTANHEMPYSFKQFGEPTEAGWPLYISMHGGGGAPKRVNDQQWENQKRLYEPENGLYLAPRAPTDSWNMWHQGYMNPLLDQLITDLILFENVDPDRVYLMGYSAGGDGVYQLAPRLADRFGAAAMMAGHPNETSAIGLRNLPFALYCGGEDSAYSRNTIAENWGKRLDELQAADPKGYVHRVKIYPGKGHWMDREDREAVPWMAEFRRNLTPDRIVWKQDDVTTPRFYWLALPADQVAGGQEIVVQQTGQTFVIEKSSADVSLAIRLRDDQVDFDQPVKVVQGDKVLFEGQVVRTIGTLFKTLSERGDPKGYFYGEVTVDVQATPSK